MGEDVGVRVEDRHRAAGEQAGLGDEVAGARTHAQVRVADVLPVALHQSHPRAPPDEPGDGAENERVVQVEQQRRVLALALVGGIVAIIERASVVAVAGWQA